ncbi:hypothetical protein OF376_00255 [Ureaplasma miroungigenitalium]|uniref:Uncharacterized protein n=1 Tax=Ureaplasma miroungigenitalium TaxID=1042321 RepID=A0ABT3BLU5_9BACT|nr:hypothetical protein [Ureaplasma miroungigenitalium]MCV3728222.1 hypothetical protein [Ureaplasma miroungigenitalium]
MSVHQYQTPLQNLAFDSSTKSVIKRFLHGSARFIASSVLISLALILVVVSMATGLKDGAFGVQSISYITVFQLAFAQLGGIVGVLIALYSNNFHARDKHQFSLNKSSQQAGSIYALLFGIFLLIIYFPTAHVYNQYANIHVNTLYTQEQGMLYIYASCGLILFSCLKQYWLSILYKSRFLKNRIMYYVFEISLYVCGLGLACLIGLLSNLTYPGFGIGLSIASFVVSMSIFAYINATHLYLRDKLVLLRTQFMAILKATWDYTLVSVFTSVIKMFTMIALFHVINDKMVGSTPLYMQSARIIWYQAMMFMQMFLFGISDYLVYLFDKQMIRQQRFHKPELFWTIVIYGSCTTIILGIIFAFSIQGFSNLYARNQDLIIPVEENAPPAYLYELFRKKLLEDENNVHKIIDGFAQTPEGRALFEQAIHVKLLTRLNNDQPLDQNILTMLEKEGFDATLNAMIKKIAADKLANDPSVLNLATQSVQIEFLKRLTKQTTLDPQLVQMVQANQFNQAVNVIIEQIKATKPTEFNELILSYQVDVIKNLMKTPTLDPLVFQMMLTNQTTELVNTLVTQKAQSIHQANPQLSLEQATVAVQKEILQGLYQSAYNDSLLTNFNEAVDNYFRNLADKNLTILVQAEITKKILNKDVLNTEFYALVNQYITNQVEALNLSDPEHKAAALILVQSELIKKLTNQTTLDPQVMQAIQNNQFNTVLDNVIMQGIQRSELMKHKVEHEVALGIIQKIIAPNQIDGQITQGLQNHGLVAVINQIVQKKAQALSVQHPELPFNQLLLGVQKEILQGLYQTKFHDNLLANFEQSVNNAYKGLVETQLNSPAVLSQAKYLAQTKILTILDSQLVNNAFVNLITKTVQDQVHNNPLVLKKIIMGVQTKILDKLNLEQGLYAQGLSMIQNNRFNDFVNNALMNQVFIPQAIDLKTQETINNLKSPDAQVALDQTKYLVDRLWVKTDEFFVQKINKVNPFTRLFKHIDANDIANEFSHKNAFIHIFLLSWFYPLALIIIRYADLIRCKTPLPVFTLIIQIAAIAFVVGFGVNYQTSDTYKGLYAWCMPLSIIGATILCAAFIIVGVNYLKYQKALTSNKPLLIN